MIVVAVRRRDWASIHLAGKRAMKANQRLKRERELRGWSQAKVAMEVGTDPATIGRWERGLSFPYPYFREKLCVLFGKNASELGLVRNKDDNKEEEPSGDEHTKQVSFPSSLSSLQ